MWRQLSVVPGMLWAFGFCWIPGSCVGVGMGVGVPLIGFGWAESSLHFWLSLEKREPSEGRRGRVVKGTQEKP